MGTSSASFRRSLPVRNRVGSRTGWEVALTDILKFGDSSTSDRFERFDLIAWWEQQRLAAAKVLLIGVGAIGNEVLKNLALLGVGSVVVVDLDLVENSNLSRSVLFRAEDCGRSKVDVAADRACEIYPEMAIRPIVANAVFDLGLGLYRWADVVIGGLDNREARVAINRAVARAGKVWIDGAIERLDGVVRVFDPACGPCYECTMSAVDWKMLETRRSCALLSRSEMEQGKVPTTPTTASVIAGIQCQEAVKYLHGLDVLEGQGFIFEGMSHQSHAVRYTRKDDCPSHEMDQNVETLPWSVDTTSVRTFLERVRTDMGPEAVIESNSDLLASLQCPQCNESETVWASLGKVTEASGRCPRCQADRIPQLVHTLDEEISCLDRPLAEIGIPPWDVLAGRTGFEQRFYEFGGDRNRVLGQALASPERGNEPT